VELKSKGGSKMIEIIKEWLMFVITIVVFVIGFSLLLIGMAWWVQLLMPFFPKL
jgi:hypothetical protein